MATLADLILSQEEPDLDDESLARELAALREKRREMDEAEVERREATGRQAPERPSSRSDSNRLPRSRPVSRAEPVRQDDAGNACEGLQLQELKPSLADAILARAEEAEESIDKEIEEMDRQLKLKVEEFRKQQRGGSPEDAGAEKQDERPTSGLVEPSFKPCESNEMGCTGHLPIMDDELQELKHLAAKMDEAFPEFPAPAGDAGPVRRPSAGGYQEPDGRSLPMDDEVSQFKSALENLDVRLRVLQSKKDLQSYEEPVVKTPVIKDLQMQNQVLRDLLSGEGRKGMLHLDRKLFSP
ncbi:unnamed protein product [Durusdinium trenchii]|uniref:Fibrous sheath-interacting protein 1 n=1 Tax=Durusdinium trenchii TaxID=1381693 RepID=A0ABP0J5R4_9DINO